VTGYYSIAHTTCDIPIGLYCGYWTPIWDDGKKEEKKTHPQYGCMRGIA
jgi:hypothetical protein